MLRPALRQCLLMFLSKTFQELLETPELLISSQLCVCLVFPFLYDDSVSEATASCQHFAPVLSTKYGLRSAWKYFSGLVDFLAPPSSAEIAVLVVRSRLPFLPPSLKRLLNFARLCWSFASYATMDRI